MSMEGKKPSIIDLEKIIALAPGHIYWKDHQGKYLGCNNTFAKVVKLPNPAAIIGKSDYDLMSKELADLVAATDKDIMAKNEERVLEEIGYDIHGKKAIYLTKKVPLQDDEGNVIGILGTSIDITERKKVEKNLHKANEELENRDELKTAFITKMAYMQNIISVLPGNIFWKDKQGKYLGCNENVARILKVSSPADVIGKSDEELIGKEYADLVAITNQEVINNNKEIIIEELGFDVNGEPATYLSRKTPLHNEKGEVIGLLGVSLDISDRKKYEEALREAKDKAEAASRAKSDFLAVISHELRIPLTGILGMAQLIDGNNLFPEQQDQLYDLIKSGNHLLSLVNDLLDIAKLEAGKMELHFAPVDLHRIVDEMTTIISHQAELKGLELIVDYPQDVPSNIIADPKALRQIILNLTGNAIKFTEKGEILIKVECLEKNDKKVILALSVQDTGVGIPADKQAIIFDRFAQADGTRTRRFGGTGLGLAIVKEYIDGMGGSISVQSEEGKGATFICKIPFELQKTSVAANPWEAYRAQVRILIVDDTLRGEVLLRQIGSSLSQVSTGDNALNTIRAAQQAKKPFDIVIIDHHLTSFEPFSLSTMIQQHRNIQHPMLLLLTNKLPLPAQKIAKEAGFFDFLIKPIQPIQSLIDLTAAWERWMEVRGSKKKILPIVSEEVGEKPQILLVEDEPITQRVHKLMLEKIGCHVDIAESGDKALMMFKDKYYDLVFMDIGLPDMDGFAVTEKMRLQEVYRGYSPIIGLTGYDSSQDRERAVMAGMDLVAIKPIKPEELQEIAINYLNRIK